MDKTLELAKKGNKRAFKKLYKSYSNYFYGYISKLICSEAIARDIFETTWQTVFLDITSINSITVSLFRTLNKVMENEKNRLGISQKMSLINNQSLIIDLHLNNKMLQLSDSDLEFLLDQILKSKYEVTFQDDNNDLHIKTNAILSELMFFSDEPFQDIKKLYDHLSTMFNYHDIDKLMTYEIYTFIDNKQKRTKILYAGLLVIVSIIMIFLGQELSLRKIEKSNEIQVIVESEANETQASIELTDNTKVILIGSLLNGSIVELDFQLINAESSTLEHTDLFIRFPRLTNNSYKLKRTNDIYTLYYDLDYEKLLLDQSILIEVSVSNAGVILIKDEFFIDLSLLEGWTKVYPINKTIETPLSQLEIIDLTLNGPFLSLNMKELQSSMQSYHSYYVIVEDNNGNQYEGMDDYIYRDKFSINFGNLPQYSTIDKFEIYFESMFFEDLTYIGRVIEDQKSFMYNNHEFTFKINRNTSGRVYFELFTDDVLFSEDYPNLLLKEKDGWLRLHQNLFPYDVNITRLDYEAVYNKTDGHVSVEEMLMYYLTTYNILLAEGDLSYQLQFLPEREFITVLVSDYKNDYLTYPTYFGDTLNDLELAIDAEFRVIEINEHFTVKIID